jgi:ribonucleotide monophosphatase NagD (HAD superfamily)
MNGQNKLHIVSPLHKTWIFDIDGTIAKHNGYKLDGEDTLLEGASDFFKAVPKEDMVVLITSREESSRAETIEFLNKSGIRYDHIIFGAPYGERILVNDSKPSGLEMSLAVNTRRDEFMKDSFTVDENL